MITRTRYPIKVFSVTATVRCYSRVQVFEHRILLFRRWIKEVAWDGADPITRAG
jgi:hypothetical protein